MRMSGFVAIILVCLVSIPVDACDEVSATDVLTKHVASELSCATGWQDVIARSAVAVDVGAQTYVRTLCRRSKTDEK